MQPYITAEMRKAVARTLRTRWIGQGPQVDQFEQAFSELVGMPCVATGSGTDALHLAYILSGIGPGDLVYAPVFTCTATNIPLLYQEARIRFIDVQANGLNMCQESMDAAIQKERPKAVITVNYGGMPSYIFPPSRVTLIEDAAQSLGSEKFKNPSVSDFVCYSFQAVKHVTTGDGGMLAMRDAEGKEKAGRIRWFGIDRKAKLDGIWANDITEVGYKYQMTDIAASMGIAALDSLEAQVAYRRNLRDLYVLGLKGIDGIRVIDQHPHSAAWLMTVDVARDREGLMASLKSHQIESGLVHYRNDRYSIFKQFSVPGSCPNMDAMESRYLCLPLHMGMKVEDVLQVCAAIRRGW